MLIRKFLCIVFVLFLCVLYLYGSANNSYNYICHLSNNFDELSYKNNTEFTIKFIDKNYDYFINKLHIKIIRIFTINDRVIVEGFCDKLSHNFNDFFGVNIQLSSFDDCCIIGVPLIDFSF